MIHTSNGLPATHRIPRAWRAFLLAVALLATPTTALALGKVRGRVFAQDTGEPMSFVNVVLLPSDTTMRRVGGLTNTDGTFELTAPAGTWTLQIRQLSYARKSVSGVRVSDSTPVELGTIALALEAIPQQEVVVEARAQQNNEKALLAVRRKAATVQDAVSAEQVRRTSDRHAGEVLRRVTGLTLNDGKYVFVRGLGERYSSTELDGVRLASPEQNKRVVPLDLIPAALLENITVQKTYTADRPAEFGGGDVQVKTKDFPGRRSLSISASQGVDEGTTNQRVLSSRNPRGDLWALGSSDRGIPDLIDQMARDRRVIVGGIFDPNGLTPADIARLGRAFPQNWGAKLTEASPNGSYSLTFGDEWNVFGRALGLVTSATYSRSFNEQNEQQRYFVGQALTPGSEPQPRFDFGVRRATEAVQLGGLGAIGYRLAPNHSLHLRGFYNRSADNEVRTYAGLSEDVQDSLQSTRVRYTQRDLLTASLEGRHEFANARRLRLEWKASRSRADLQRPDQRESRYQRFTDYDENDNPIRAWGLRQDRGATRKYQDMRELGRGMELHASVPVAFGVLGKGKFAMGWNDQWKNRDFYYRRFSFKPAAGRLVGPADSLLSPDDFTGRNGGATVEEYTFLNDNYDAEQGQTALYAAVDLPFGPRVKTQLGLRMEYGLQAVRAFYLFSPSRTEAAGRIEQTDLLPSANVTWNVLENVNLRFGASRTLSRPDLAEMAPVLLEDYVPGFRDMPGLYFRGNPNLVRARLENWDVRLEAFPGLSEVFAIGAFTKRLEHPVELSAGGGSEPVFTPINSEEGRNSGIEAEVRASLGRVWKPLAPLTINSNYTAIRSKVRLPRRSTELVASEHPLQGQADRIVNFGVTFAGLRDRLDASLQLTHTGRKLAALGIAPAPDFYDEPLTTLDLAANLRPLPYLRVKLSGSNLTDATTVVKQGPFDSIRYRPGRGYSVSVQFGS